LRTECVVVVALTEHVAVVDVEVVEVVVVVAGIALLVAVVDVEVVVVVVVVAVIASPAAVMVVVVVVVVVPAYLPTVALSPIVAEASRYCSSFRSSCCRSDM
jgi:hypothetical protein